MISIRCWVNKPSGLDEVDEAAMQEEQVEGVVEEDGEEEEEEEEKLKLNITEANLAGKNESGGKSPGLDSLNECWVRGGWNENPTLLEPCLGGWNSGGPGYGRFCQGWKAGDWPPF